MESTGRARDAQHPDKSFWKGMGVARWKAAVAAFISGFGSGSVLFRGSLLLVGTPQKLAVSNKRMRSIQQKGLKEEGSFRGEGKTFLKSFPLPSNKFPPFPSSLPIFYKRFSYARVRACIKEKGEKTQKNS